MLQLLLILTASQGQSPAEMFDRKVAPILIEHCWDCHSGARPKGGLDVTRAKSLSTGGDSGPALVSKDLKQSMLWQRIAANEMPPKHPLSAAEKATIKTWIESGGLWGAEPLDPFRVSTTKRAGADWWSLQPIQKPSPPVIDGVTNPIDRFVLAQLKVKGLTPSKEADRRTLIRRLSFDLLGLPPSWEDVDAFVRDDRLDAYERLVDRLLASPHYGERWARHWLDVVRFGESDGFERNAPRANAWPYRDWVVEALNADMPFDEFCRIQIAGDVLKPGDTNAIRATGYLVAGIHNTVLPNLKRLKDAAFHDELEDLVGNVGQTFLGLTTNCARCHDHKFDPISTKDYYQFASALSGVQHGERDILHAPTDPKPLEIELVQASDKLNRLLDQARQAYFKSGAMAQTSKLAPAPIAAWDFREGLKDQLGNLDVALNGAAKQARTGLILDGKTGFGKTMPLPVALREKTLEAWVQLDNLNQRGGGVMSIQSGDRFDAIVFAEKEPKRWLPGSDFFRRTAPLGGPEESAQQQSVHVAIAYHADGSIVAFRAGQPYGQAYKTQAPFTTEAKKSHLLFGLRHEPAGGNRLLAGVIEQARLYDRALTADEISLSAQGSKTVPEQELWKRLSDADRKTAEDLKKHRDELLTKLAKVRAAERKQKIYAVISKQPEPMRIMHRGQVTDPGETVSAAGIAVMASSQFNLGPDAPEGERRRKLAEWITGADNPLFARMLVNRLWHHHFGIGIVETPSDFGFNGGRPSHPELLDWLASDFMAGGYRIKRMHRLIVTSQTYRQESKPQAHGLKVDADNRLLWRKKPMRLDAETVRDTLLSSTGLLNTAVGGKGFSDYRETSGNGTTFYDPFDPVGPEFQRRSLYRFQPRSANPGLLDAFDCPDPAGSTPRRNATTTPLQALALWNGEFPLRLAGTLADRVRREAGDDAKAQIARCYQRTLQRDPDAAELARAQALVAAHGLRALVRALFNTNEFLTAE